MKLLIQKREWSDRKAIQNLNGKVYRNVNDRGMDRRKDNINWLARITLQSGKKVKLSLKFAILNYKVKDCMLSKYVEFCASIMSIDKGLYIYKMCFVTF